MKISALKSKVVDLEVEAVHLEEKIKDLKLAVASGNDLVEMKNREIDHLKSRIQLLEEHFGVGPETKFLKCPKCSHHQYISDEGRPYCLRCGNERAFQLQRMIVLSSVAPDLFRIKLNLGDIELQKFVAPSPTSPKYSLAVPPVPSTPKK